MFLGILRNVNVRATASVASEEKHLQLFQLLRCWVNSATLVPKVKYQFFFDFLIFFFTIWVFFHERSRITGLQGKGEGISLTPHYHFHPLHRHLDISWAITAENSPLHIVSSRTRTGNLWFPSASRKEARFCWHGLF